MSFCIIYFRKKHDERSDTLSFGLAYNQLGVRLPQDTELKDQSNWVQH